MKMKTGPIILRVTDDAPLVLRTTEKTTNKTFFGNQTTSTSSFPTNYTHLVNHNLNSSQRLPHFYASTHAHVHERTQTQLSCPIAQLPLHGHARL